MRVMLLASLSASLLVSATSCVTIRDAATCSVAGNLSAGSICSHLISSDTFDLTFEETIDLLEAQDERDCVPVPGLNVCSTTTIQGASKKLPARAAAICSPADDWNAMKTELEVACRELGPRCSLELQQLLQRLK